MRKGPAAVRRTGPFTRFRRPSLSAPGRTRHHVTAYARHLLCCESATVTPTRWNSFSSL